MNLQTCWSIPFWCCYTKHYYVLYLYHTPIDPIIGRFQLLWAACKNWNELSISSRHITGTLIISRDVTAPGTGIISMDGICKIIVCYSDRPGADGYRGRDDALRVKQEHQVWTPTTLVGRSLSLHNRPLICKCSLCCFRSYKQKVKTHV